jgi:hypothetical protein
MEGPGNAVIEGYATRTNRSAKKSGCESLSLCAGWRREFQAVFLADLDYAGNVLLLLRAQRADVLKEPFETCWCDDAHETARCLAEVTIGVRDAARGENRGTFLRDECFFADGPFVVTFEDLKGLVLSVVDVRRRARRTFCSALRICILIPRWRDGWGKGQFACMHGSLISRMRNFPPTIRWRDNLHR